MDSSTDKVRVWDLPVRLFHWLLFVLVTISLYTGFTGGFYEMDYHMLSGYGILGLVLFRIGWGFFGSTYSRFSSLVRPGEILPYLRDLKHGVHKPAAGHNPLGGLSVIAMLLVLALQATTGMFANDDIMLEGPLVHLVSDETSDQLTSIHHYNKWLLLVLLTLHILAIAFYEIIKKERLILPMISGRKEAVIVADGKPSLAKEPSLVKEVGAAICVGLIAAGITYYIVTQL